MSVYHVCVLGDYGGRKGLRSCGTELEVVVNHPPWALGTEPGSSGRAGGALNCGAVSPALQSTNFIKEDVRCV